MTTTTSILDKLLSIVLKIDSLLPTEVRESNYFLNISPFEAEAKGWIPKTNESLVLQQFKFIHELTEQDILEIIENIIKPSKAWGDELQKTDRPYWYFIRPHDYDKAKLILRLKINLSDLKAEDIAMLEKRFPSVLVELSP